MNHSPADEPSAEPWHLVLHGLPPHVIAGPTLEIQQAPLATIQLPQGTQADPLPIDFESAYLALEQLGLFIEGDGSFCWTAPQAVWRLFGELYDGGTYLHYAELKGSCPQAEWEQVLAALGSQRGPLMIQLVRQGVYVDPQAFAAWMWR